MRYQDYLEDLNFFIDVQKMELLKQLFVDQNVLNVERKWFMLEGEKQLERFEESYFCEVRNSFLFSASLFKPQKILERFV
jgi:hypothetical protein